MGTVRHDYDGMKFREHYLGGDKNLQLGEFLGSGGYAEVHEVYSGREHFALAYFSDIQYSTRSGNNPNEGFS